MTVGELRALLADMPDDVRVVVYDGSGDVVDLEHTERVHCAVDGTGIHAVKNELDELERWVRRNAPHADIDPHPALLLGEQWEDA